MITLDRDVLQFSFPQLHENARMTVEFQRTLRIPDDGKSYPLPPGLGNFPLRHIDDFAARLDPTLVARGGVVLPMHASEAMWLRFGTLGFLDFPYPFALKIAAGKINCITGEPWSAELHSDPQDYIVVPLQPWVDGFAVAKGVIRQFVAERLGEGHSVEEQLTGKAEFGGLQIVAYPMKADRYAAKLEELRQRQRQKLRNDLTELVRAIDADASRCEAGLEKLAAFRSRAEALLNAVDTNTPSAMRELQLLYAEYNAARHGNRPHAESLDFFDSAHFRACRPRLANSPTMGMAAGGRMRQEIYADHYGLDAWDQSVSGRCFVTLLPAEAWKSITGEPAPTAAPTAQTYAKANLPWFDYANSNATPLSGGSAFSKLKSWAESKFAKGQSVHDNETINPSPEILLGSARFGAPSQVREPQCRG